MSGAVKITRVDLSAAQLRKLSKKEKNPLIVRRMLAIALVLEGTRRRPAAEACGMDRQTLRDWVHHYNKQGIAGLGERRTSGNKSPLGEVERKALVELLEKGDFQQWIERYVTFQNKFRHASALFILESEVDVVCQKYGAKGYRLAAMDVGIVCQLLYMIGTSLGLGVCATAGFFESEVESALMLGKHSSISALIFGCGPKVKGVSGILCVVPG